MSAPLSPAQILRRVAELAPAKGLAQTNSVLEAYEVAGASISVSAKVGSGRFIGTLKRLLFLQAQGACVVYEIESAKLGKRGRNTSVR